jgi:uncharacterized protein YpmB
MDMEWIICILGILIVFVVLVVLWLLFFGECFDSKPNGDTDRDACDGAEKQHFGVQGQHCGMF